MYRYRPWNLTADEIRQCASLNFQSTGEMQYQFAFCRRESQDAWVYFIKDENDKILSWTLVWRDSVTDKSVRAMFWTRRSERRSGYASRLMRRIQKDHSNITVYPHDTASYAFFDKHRRPRRNRSYV